MSDLSGVGIVFANVFPGSRLGGGEMHLLHLARGAQAAGMSVALVAIPESGVARVAAQDGFTVIEDDLRGYAPPGAASALVGHLRKSRARIVQGSGYYTNVLARLAGRRAHCLVVNEVLCEPNSTLSFERGLRGRLAQRVRDGVDHATKARADAIITVSQALADAVVAGGADAARVSVIHNAIDPKALKEDAALGTLPDDMPPSPAIGTVGRLEAVKGLGVFLDAVPLVAEAHPEAHFIIAGEGPYGSTLHKRVAQEPALHGRVRLPGFAPSAPALMSALTVYCLPSFSEGFNTTILEAMALDVPVVATDVGGTREAVVDTVTGRLVPPRDPAALAEALCWMLEHPRLRSKVAIAGRQLVEKEFTVKRMVRRTLDVYRSLLDEADRAAAEQPA